jgi:thymidylate kinase
VVWLADALETARLRYCQFKGRGSFERWAFGHGDIDLLVDRAEASPLAALLGQLGFKLALPAAGRGVPGVLSYVALDAHCARLIHLHVHFNVILGRSWSRHFQLPVEQAVLDAAVPGPLFRVPAPEFEFVLYVLGKTLRHRLKEVLGGGLPPWLRAAQAELDVIEEGVSRSGLERVLVCHVPEILPACFDRCLASLRVRTARWRRLAARYELERRLASYARRPPVGAQVTAAVDRAGRLAGIRIPGAPGPRKRLATGGAVVALAGADGAGKSTSARALESWLASELETSRAHLGRPPRSLLTLAVGAAWKAARALSRGRPRSPHGFSAHLELARMVCTARDRYRLYRRVRRAATAGAVVICERYPLFQDRALVGPSWEQGRALDANTRVGELLRRWEARYYERMAGPELVLVLRVDPDTAVRRKPEEPEEYVRDRARTSWDTDWAHVRGHVVDARRPFAEVLAEVRRRVWEAL